MEGKCLRMTPEIKICGITKKEEIDALQEAKVDYAGFVFFPKSKRNVTLNQAKELLEYMKQQSWPGEKKMKTVAVVVSPDDELMEALNRFHFDLVQIHGRLEQSVLETCRTTIWRALNFSDDTKIEKNALEKTEKITGYVVDGVTYGGGKTFEWKSFYENNLKELKHLLRPNQKFILAGGLKKDNVTQGIHLFKPDVVDVSSGVEGKNGKDRSKILEFVRMVQKNG